MESTDNQDHDVNQRIAASVRALRQQAGLSLEELAAATGVSRSALSQIERAQSSPTAVVLSRIATGLGVPLASLFGAAQTSAPAQPLARLAEQPTWQDPASGYVRRAVSPAQFPSPIQIVEVLFPPGARVSIDNVPRHTTVHQQIWMLEGRMNFSVGDTAYRLEAGDCLAHTLDAPTHFHNPARKPARYAVALVSEPLARKA
jgi:transcriptional regulator with XRE-family HTH domain